MIRNLNIIYTIAVKVTGSGFHACTMTAVFDSPVGLNLMTPEATPASPSTDAWRLGSMVYTPSWNRTYVPAAAADRSGVQTVKVMVGATAYAGAGKVYPAGDHFYTPSV